MSTTALRAAATTGTGTAIATERQKTILDLLENKRVVAGLTAVSGKLLQPERLLRLLVNAVKKTPRLMECDPMSVLGAMMASAALGLEPNTVQQQAFLIPYKKRVKRGNDWADAFDCQFQVGARGFITLGYRSPQIGKWGARCIHKGDHFKEMSGSRAFLEHSVALIDRGDPIGAYSHVVHSNGMEESLVLPLDEILKIRTRSETWRTLTRNIESARDDRERSKAEVSLAETPWVMWFGEMAEKSAVKRHAKKLPIAASEALAAAADLDTRSDEGTLDLAALTDPDLVRSVVADEETAPALAHQPGERLEGGEAFGATVRQRENVESGGQPAAKPQRATRKADPAAGAAPTANDFVMRIDATKDTAAADAVLAEARAAGLADDQLAIVVDAHRMATADLGPAT